ncbi:MAG: 5-(carboxyamino)imidazole ribonucleotide mutase [Lachnospiraceae bacterium]|nr:5-(carboxyamino)imidazole ribonucleotide mutase [Lachnospiraceae bacterium]
MKKQVGIIMGSDSDMEIMAQAAKVLDDFGISYDMDIISAHREPLELVEYGERAKERDYQVIIAGAGKAAALPGMCAALFPLPVIGIPMKTSDLGGVDSLYSIVQMPSGVPVATVAINGGKNAGILAAKILSVGDSDLRKRVFDFQSNLKNETISKNEKLQKLGWREYLEQK